MAVKLTKGLLINIVHYLGCAPLAAGRKQIRLVVIRGLVSFCFSIGVHLMHAYRHMTNRRNNFLSSSDFNSTFSLTCQSGFPNL